MGVCALTLPVAAGDVAKKLEPLVGEAFTAGEAVAVVAALMGSDGEREMRCGDV
jgi:hypothetical protein